MWPKAKNPFGNAVERDLGLRGPLRGVKKIDMRRLRAALKLVAVKTEPGRYLVASPAVLEEAAQFAGDDAAFWEFLGRAHYCRRKTKDFNPPYETISVVDVEGYNSYWVDLTDRQVDACHCRDMMIDAFVQATPCKHMLAALIAEKHPYIMDKVAELEKRDRIAEAARKEE